MNPLIKNTIICILLGVIFQACQETYDAELLHEEIEIPSIEAVLTNKVGMNMVKISWLAEFERGYNEPVMNAAVVITDNDNKPMPFVHDKNGIYLPLDTTFAGDTGKSYKLEITLDDGEIYGTRFIELRKEAKIDTMHAKVGKIDVVSTGVSGETRIEEKEGLEISYNLSSPNLSRQYFLLSSKILYQYNYDVYIPPSTEIKVYMWRGEYAYDVPKIEMSEILGDKQVALNIDAGFLIYEWDQSTRSISTRPSIRIGAAYPVGWIVEITCQVVNENTYGFYKGLSRQLLSEDRIFDPVPYQIKGNINCLSDTGKLVVGNFNVGPITTQTYGFYWAAGGETMLSKKIENRDFPLIKGNTSESSQEPMPEFWYEYNRGK